MNVTHIQSKQFQASFKHRLPLCLSGLWSCGFFFSFFLSFIVIIMLWNFISTRPIKGLWFVDVSSICDIEWFNLATRECIKQWAACKTIYCSYFILGLLCTALAPIVSPSNAPHGPATERQWLYSWYGLDLLSMRLNRVMCGSVCKWDCFKWKFGRKKHPLHFETTQWLYYKQKWLIKPQKRSKSLTLTGCIGSRLFPKLCCTGNNNFTANSVQCSLICQLPLLAQFHIDWGSFFLFCPYVSLRSICE